MEYFLKWLGEFLTLMFKSFWNGIVSFFTGIIKIFDFPTYFGMFSDYSADMSAGGKILSVVSFILVYAFWISIIILIVFACKKLFRFRKTVIQNDDLLEEIANLHNDIDRLVKEKERIMELKLGPDIHFDSLTNDIEGGTGNGNNLPELEDNVEMQGAPRFFRLSQIDEKYVSYIPPEYSEVTMNLKEICDDFRNFACFNSHLYYEIKTIRLMFAGLSTTKLVLLQGISGTGKTSLPYCMGKYFENETTIASVQPSWKDRSELFGFYNEFTKKFNETEVLCRIYESNFEDNINIVVLDELNIARVEYYFAEMLSVLELPDHESWKIQLVSNVWGNDPAKLVDGRLSIPENVFYVGTANNDDSTYSVSDKVYDRAFTINLNAKGIAFDAPETTAKRIPYSYLDGLYKEAVAKDPVSKQLLEKIGKLDNYVIEKFRVAFGNRIMKQLETFVPVYKACGGSEVEAVDYILCTKVFRKFEGLNIVLIRDEIKGLISQLDQIFGKNSMEESIKFLQRLQKSY